ncbi:hypothetical protein MAR_032561 [Mya arenaria]|uniref:Uncharacterized protein n=1 Tax=Mya arenaria TaxID=6604 RepID=A0ABY7FAC0_MYAAR|nr:hypothetical protein MAR_032561 [Mya arenaria]
MVDPLKKLQPKQDIFQKAKPLLPEGPSFQFKGFHEVGFHELQNAHVDPLTKRPYSSWAIHEQPQEKLDQFGNPVGTVQRSLALFNIRKWQDRILDEHS